MPDIRTETMTVNMGPQHPSTHGVLRLVLELDGEVIQSAMPTIGYLHTGIEKTAEQKKWQQVIPLVERMDYLAAQSNSLAFCLSVERLLEAYRRGVFPWYSGTEPVLWWSPDPRMVLYCEELKVSRSLAKNVRNKGYEVRIDTAFAEVLKGCAERPQTWLGTDMKKAYLRLHRAGHAHCFETWLGDELVGGLYGVAIGRMFYGESMFTLRPDASKVAFAGLVAQLERWGFELIDCQMATTHLSSLGAREIPRAEFLQHVKRLTALPGPASPWRLDADLTEGP